MVVQVKRLPILFIPFFTVLLYTSLSTPNDAGLLKGASQRPPEKSVLDNGLIVVTKKVPSSGLVSIDVRVKAGSAYEGEFAGSGISHFVEHMLFKSTQKAGPGQIEREIRSLGGQINGSTIHDYTAFTITIPKDHLGRALELLSDSLFNSNMDPREIETERGVILKEIMLNRDDPARYISQLLWSLVYKSHPYRHPVIGYESSFRKLTRDDLLKYYKNMYVPNNMVLVLVGDLEDEDALDDVKRYFGHIERGMLQEEVLPQEKTQTSKRFLEMERDLAMAYFALGYHTVDVHNKYMAALDVLSVILGQGESSRLNTVLYRKKELVYSVGSWNYTPNDPGIFIISGIAEPKKLKAALGALSEEIKNIKSGVIDDKELVRAKAMIISDYIYSLQMFSDQARDLATSELLTGDFNFTKRYLEAIDAVTRDDVIKAARLYLKSDSSSLVTLSPLVEKGAKEPKEEPQKDIKKISLPNGLRCLLMQDHRLPIASITAVSLGGLRVETDKDAGLSNLAGLMLLKGTHSRSEEDISHLVEAMGGNLSYFSGNDTFGLRFDILSRDLDKAFELFGDIIMNSNFPEEVLRRERDSVIAMIRSTDDDIFSAGMKIFKETLFKTHPYRYQTIGRIDSVSNLKREDLQAFHKRYFAPNNMVIAIFGDIDIQAIEDRIHKDFGALTKGPEPEFTKIKEPLQEEIREEMKALEKEQDVVVMGFKGATIHGKDRYALQILSTALSGVDGRLSARLREQLGIVYAVGTVSVPALDGGYFALYAATAGGDAEEVKKEFLRQLHILNKNGLTAEEIDSAKKELIGNQRISLQANSALAHHTALDELYGLGYDNYKRYAEYINSVTNEEVIKASQGYLKPDAFSVIVIEGKKR